MKNLVKKIWDDVKQPAKVLAAVACFGMLPSSCRRDNQKDEVRTKDMLYYAQHNIPIDGEDMYANPIRMKVLDIRVYDDATMENKKGGECYQMRWGIPASELSVEPGEKTHAVYAFLDEIGNSKGWVEVYENKYGISVVKDQPCFIVDKKGYLRIVGDSTNYEPNMIKYYNDLIEAEKRMRYRAEQNRQEYYNQQTAWNNDLQEPTDENQITAPADSTLNDTNIYVMPADSTVRDSAKYVITRDDSMYKKPVLTDSLTLDSMNSGGR